MRAIQARSDAIDKLECICERAQAAADMHSGFLPISDPIMRLLFSTVARLRTKTLDAVERVAAWERAVGAGRPFVHRYVADTNSYCCAVVLMHHSGRNRHAML